MKRGDFVWIEYDGQRKQAMVTLASENEDSLMVMWGDGMLGGYCGMMPLLRENGEYRDLVEGKPVKVERAEP
jgi:hypothetical protein